MRGTQRGVVNRGMFIERMKECSKYSRDRNLRFASDEARTDTKNKKRLIIMESSILAQDERWRQA